MKSFCRSQTWMWGQSWGLESAGAKGVTFLSSRPAHGWAGLGMSCPHLPLLPVALSWGCVLTSS